MATRTSADEALITTFGRLIEASAGLTQQLGQSLEHEAGISHSWFEVLLRISRSEGGQISMGALAQQVALTTGGITRLVDRMIAAGLVQRVPCPTDRRVSYAALTAAGRTKLAEATTGHVANLRRAFASFNGADLRTLDALLDRLRAATID